MTQNIKQQLHTMYIGLVFTHWADKDNTKLGTAKQKSLQQMQNFAKTVDKKNPVAQEITAQVNEMIRSVSKQIMTDKSSEMVLDKKLKSEYKAFGEKQASESKKQLKHMIEQGGKTLSKSPNVMQMQKTQEKSKEQDMLAKQKAPQYQATKTNVAHKGDKPTMTLQKLDQQEFMRFLIQRQYQKAA